MPWFDWSRHFTSVAFGAAVAPFMISVPWTDSTSSQWALTLICTTLIAIGMTRTARQPRLWQIDEAPSTGSRGSVKDRAGLMIAIAGVLIMIAAFPLAFAVTSRLCDTGVWAEDAFAMRFIILLVAGLICGLMVLMAGMIRMQDDTPFPHWRIRYRPP